MTKLNFNPFPELETERLILRQLIKTDNQEIFFLRSDDKVNQYIDRPKIKTIFQADAFIDRINNYIAENRSVYWAISLKENPQLIGTICLWNFSDTTAELGYELNPQYQGKGIMNEAMEKVLNYGFNLIGMEIIEAYTHKDNTSSIKLLIKHGFKLDALQKDAENENNIIFTKNNLLITDK